MAENPALAVVGEPGIGRSALLANWAEQVNTSILIAFVVDICAIASYRSSWTCCCDALYRLHVIVDLCANNASSVKFNFVSFSMILFHCFCIDYCSKSNVNLHYQHHLKVNKWVTFAINVIEFWSIVAPEDEKEFVQSFPRLLERTLARNRRSRLVRYFVLFCIFVSLKSLWTGVGDRWHR